MDNKSIEDSLGIDYQKVFEDLDYAIKNAKTTTLFSDVKRECDVADMKEIYSRDHMLKHGYCTAEEYDRIPASTIRADTKRNLRDIAYLMNQVVGAEE